MNKKPDLGEYVWVKHGKTEHPAFKVKGFSPTEKYDVMWVFIEWQSTGGRQWVPVDDLVEPPSRSKRSRRPVVPSLATASNERPLKRSRRSRLAKKEPNADKEITKKKHKNDSQDDTLTITTTNTTTVTVTECTTTQLQRVNAKRKTPFVSQQRKLPSAAPQKVVSTSINSTTSTQLPAKKLLTKAPVLKRQKQKDTRQVPQVTLSNAQQIPKAKDLPVHKATTTAKAKPLHKTKPPRVPKEGDFVFSQDSNAPVYRVYGTCQFFHRFKHIPTVLQLRRLNGAKNDFQVDYITVKSKDTLVHQRDPAKVASLLKKATQAMQPATSPSLATVMAKQHAQQQQQQPVAQAS